MRRRPSQALEMFEMGTFAAGAAAVLAGDRMPLPELEAAGMLMLAVAPAAIGLQALRSGRLRLPTDHYSEREELYKGIGARAWAMFFLLASAALGLGGLHKFGALQLNLDKLLDRWPGMAAVIAGTGLLLFGIADASKVILLEREKPRRVWMIPERIGGCVTALLGLALIAGGLLHTIAPGLFSALTGAAQRTLLELAKRIL